MSDKVQKSKDKGLHVIRAAISKLVNQDKPGVYYEALIFAKKKSRGLSSMSEIRITCRDKKTVERQLRDIIALYPPDETVSILDLDKMEVRD